MRKGKGGTGKGKRRVNLIGAAVAVGLFFILFLKKWGKGRRWCCWRKEVEDRYGVILHVDLRWCLVGSVEDGWRSMLRGEYVMSQGF